MRDDIIYLFSFYEKARQKFFHVVPNEDSCKMILGTIFVCLSSRELDLLKQFCKLFSFLLQNVFLIFLLMIWHESSSIKQHFFCLNISRTHCDAPLNARWYYIYTKTWYFLFWLKVNLFSIRSITWQCSGPCWMQMSGVASVPLSI